MKTSKATLPQRRVLERLCAGDVMVSLCEFTSYAVGDLRGELKPIHSMVGWSLIFREYVTKTDHCIHGEVYEITTAGRAALEQTP